MTFMTRVSALSLTALLALTGCSSMADSLEETSVSMGAPDIAYTEDMAVEMDMQGRADESAASFEPDIIRTGYLSLSVDSPSATADEIRGAGRLGEKLIQALNCCLQNTDASIEVYLLQ